MKGGGRSLLLGVLLCVGLGWLVLAGRRMPTEEEKREVAPTRVSVGFWKCEQYLVGDELQSFLEEKFQLQLVPVNLSEIRWKDDLQKMVIRGDLPDLFVNDMTGTQGYQDWKAQGIIQKITGNMEGYPHLEEYLGEAYLDKMKDEEGMLYCIPRKGFEEEEQVGLMRCVLLRKDLLEELGLEEPGSYEEFRTMLQTFAKDCEEKGVESVPLVTENANKLEALYLGLYPELCNLERGWILEDGKYIPAYYSDNMDKGLYVLRQLYEEGLLDRKFPYRNVEEAEQLFVSGKSIALCLPYFRLVQDCKRIAPDFSPEESVSVMRPWELEDGSIYRFATTRHWSELYIGHHVDARKRDKILSLLDYLLSEEFIEDIRRMEFQKEPSIHFFTDLITLGITFEYRHPDLYDDYYSDKMYQYIEEENRWYNTSTQKPPYQMEIPLFYTPKKEKLPGNQKIHDEMIKIIISDEDVTTAWNRVRQMLESEYDIGAAIEEVSGQFPDASLTQP